MNEFNVKNPEILSEIRDSKANAEPKSYNSGLRALLTFRDRGFVLENHYARILQIETRAKEMGQSALQEVESSCPPGTFEQLQNALNLITGTVLSMTKLLNAVKEKIAKNERSDSTELWNRFDKESASLRENFTNLEDLGMALLPEGALIAWQESIHKFRASLLTNIFSYAKACKIELSMIERYTSEEMNKITQIIVDKIPADFSAGEAAEYEQDYLVALKDFKKEFSQEKNLWDKFLDILAGGVHQSPDEHVMMERWIEGEKGTL
jgi:hypothetical protein